MVKAAVAYARWSQDVRDEFLTVERAFELVKAKNVSSFRQLVDLLKAEGYSTALTDLRGTLIRRDLRRLYR